MATDAAKVKQAMREAREIEELAQASQAFGEFEYAIRAAKEFNSK